MDWPIFKPEPATRPFITTIEETFRMTGQTPPLTSRAVTVSNAAAFLAPIWLPVPMLVKRLALFNGAVVAGNIQLGIYRTRRGSGGRYGDLPPLGLIVATAVTAQVGTNVWQAIAIANTWLPAGSYYIGAWFSLSTAQYMAVTATPVLSGCWLDTSGAAGLPTSAVNAFTDTYISPALALTGVA